jgi:alpha-glucosidase (family GH31 glycosyl hydrolase)
MNKDVHSPYPATRRAFLSQLALSAGAALTPEGLVQAGAGLPTQGFYLAGAAVEVWLTAVTASTLRISILKKGSGPNPVESFRGPGLDERAWPPALARLSEGVPSASVSWGARKIVVSASPLSVAVFDDQSQAIQRLVFDDATGKVSFRLDGQPVFGLGEGGHQFDRRGVVDSMRNGQFKPDQFLNGGRSPIPWLLSPAGWALFFHHPMGTFDLTGPEGVFRVSEPPQPQDIFFIADKSPAVLLREYARLTGMPHMPPLWALGYQQSHRTLASREEVLEETKTFRAKKLPCDVMIYLGTGFAPSGWNSGHGSFGFNQKIFPDPEVMFGQMHDEGFRVVLHVLGVPHDLHGRIADHSADADDAANYWQNHLRVFQTGVDGWWVDDGDELFPEARLTRNRMYWEGPLRERPGVRPYSIQRNGYAGLQRYGFLWSGDTNSSWKTLRVQIADGLNTGLSGIPYWGTDTGGFFTTPELTAELYLRWFQFSSFCPLFRSHGRTWKLRLPWGWDQGDPGPIEDDPKVLPPSDQLHNPDVERICRRYLNLRYQLLPYLYSSVYQTHRTGVPLMRALWLGSTGDTRTLGVDDAYMWGDALLVAPVTEAGATERRVYLPEGVWFNFWTNNKVQGAAEVVAPAALDTIPLFVRAGSILPMGPVKQYAMEPSSAAMELIVYPGSDGQLSLYEDDGHSMLYANGVYSLLEIAWNDAERRLSVRLAAVSRVHPFTSRRFVAHLMDGSSRKEMVFDGAPLSCTL